MGTSTKSLAFERTDCRLCGHEVLREVLSLEPTPLANEFVLEPVEQELVPLDVMRCDRCRHVQLRHVVDPERLYPDYLYSTATFRDPPAWHPVVRDFKAYADAMMERFAPTKVLDIGSNDGTLLGAFPDRCVKVGVEPAEDLAAQSLSGHGLDDVYCGFFGAEAADTLLSKHGTFDLITANNVFAHVDDLLQALCAAASLLAPGGTFVMQVSYLPDILEKCAFDTMYHEHLDYHTLGPLEFRADRMGLVIYDVEHVGLYGGSIRMYMRLRSGGDELNISNRVRDTTEYEELLGLGSRHTWQQFRDRIAWAKQRLLDDLEGLKRVVGFGAPAKLTTMMYQFGLQDRIVAVVDDTPAKQGRLTPGSHIPIHPTSELAALEPDGVLIFAWNCADAIKAQHPGYNYIVPRFTL